MDENIKRSNCDQTLTGTFFLCNIPKNNPH